MAHDSTSSSTSNNSEPSSTEATAKDVTEGGAEGAAAANDTATDEGSLEVAGDQVANVAQEFTDRVDGLREFLPEPLMAVWDTVAQYPIIGSIVVALFGFLAARVIVWLMRNALSQVSKHTKTTTDDKLISMLERPVFITVFFFFLVLALRPLVGGAIYNGIGNIMASVVILVWLMALLPASKLLLDSLGRNGSRFKIIEERTIPLFNILSIVLLWGMGAYILLILWGINPAAWLASAGVLGIAIGFAAKDTLSNLFSGVFIVADSPYQIGDFVNLDSGERGQVTHVGLRSTRLLTRDDVEITIPNAVIANAKIINESGGHSVKSRIRIKVGVAYGSDAEQVVSVLEDVADKDNAIARSPEPRVRMRGFGDSSVDFELLCWINTPVERGKITHELYMAVYKRFADENIEIPFPQRDLYIRSMPKQISE